MDPQECPVVLQVSEIQTKQKKYAEENKEHDVILDWTFYAYGVCFDDYPPDH